MAKKIEQSLAAFMQVLEQAITVASLNKVVLSKCCGADSSLQRITLTLLELKGELMLSWVSTHTTQTLTENCGIGESLERISHAIGKDFKAAHVFYNEGELQLNISKKGKVQLVQHVPKTALHLSQHQTKLTAKPSSPGLKHNRDKKRFVDIQRPFLQALKVTDAQGELIPAMSKKWKQINKFIEVLSQAIDHSPLASALQHSAIESPVDSPVKQKLLNVVDFGSGKGYLTFAIHDYLRHERQHAGEVVGVELRQELAQLCQTTAEQLDHRGLSFVCGDVKTHAPQSCDIMIALHACDVATDYAIHYGIQAEAAIIMCSPCCHKQIRPQMQSPKLFKPMLQYGVHLGQEAEMVTDSLRALLLELHGYKTKIFEFISLEHTNKNKMILAVKRPKPIKAAEKKALAEQIAAIKDFYGLTEHCLETLLAGS